MSTVPAVATAMVVLAAAGALPAWRLVGWRPVTVFLAPLMGMLLAGIAGGLAVTVAGDTLRWFLTLAGAANAAALGSMASHHDHQQVQPDDAKLSSEAGGAGASGSTSSGELGGASSARRAEKPGWGSPSWLSGVGVLGVLAVGASVGWCLKALVRPQIGFDARTIWLLHATWLADGHATARRALSNPALPFAHASYPPLAGGVVALAWLITATHSDRVGVVVLSLCTACAVAAAGTVLVEAGIEVAGRVRRAGSYVPVSLLVGLLGAAAGSAWCLGVYGITGAGATDGYVDLLWSACAVGAAGLGLVLSLSGSSVRAAGVLLLVAALTKNEGIATGAVLVALVAWRWWRGGRGVGMVRGGRRRIVSWAVVAEAAVIAWPVTMLLLHAQPDADTVGHRYGGIFSRLDVTVHGMAGDLHLAGLALAAGVVGTVLLGRRRRSLGLGADPWLWVAGGAEVAATAAFYVIGTTEIQFWLDTSVARVTIFADALGLAAFGYWLVVAGSAALGPRADKLRSLPAAEASSEHCHPPAPISVGSRDAGGDPPGDAAMDPGGDTAGGAAHDAQQSRAVGSGGLLHDPLRLDAGADSVLHRHP